jgi:hypothetical protein
MASLQTGNMQIVLQMKIKCKKVCKPLRMKKELHERIVCKSMCKSGANFAPSQIKHFKGATDADATSTQSWGCIC